MTVIAAVTLSACAAAPADSSGGPEHFGIYTSRLDGGELRCLISDQNREMNHARLSPDKQWITFTRYNKRNWLGAAKEENGYEETEIMLARSDGSGARSLVPPRKDVIAANGYWTEDGKAILFVSNDNARHAGEIRRVDVATGAVSKVAIAGDPWAADPHRVGRQMVISVFDPAQVQTSIWLADIDGRSARPLTRPPVRGLAPGDTPPLGDFDPKLSPDGMRVATMRHVGSRNWHLVIVDIADGAERDLSAAQAVDGVPEWSSDGAALIFWHIDTEHLKQSGLYITDNEGRARKRVPLPGGFFYTMPAFFPGEGSSDDAHIIFSGQKSWLF